MLKKVLLYSFLLLAALQLQAQSLNTEVLTERFKVYQAANPAAGLYVHTDKNVYTNNEKIWFSAYLINAGKQDTTQSFVCVSLIYSDTRKVVIEQKFKLERDLSSGSLLLPDTLAPGNYQLLCFTSKLKNPTQPLASYSSPITIHNTNVPVFKATMALVESTAGNDYFKVKVMVSPEDKPSTKARPVLAVVYSVGGGKEQSISSKANEAVILIPKKDITGANARVVAAITYGQQTQHLNLQLPVPVPKMLKVKFYPEGGSLSSGITSLIGWEAKSEQGIPIQVEGQLLKDGKPLDNIKTTSQGTGKFSLMPVAGSLYSVKIKAGIYLESDTVISLPKLTSVGIGMHVNEAVTNDTLKMTLYSLAKTPVHILVHNYQGNYLLAKANLTSPESNIELPLNAMPKGLASLTILDTMGMPLAERLIFCHYNDSTSIALSADKVRYGKNDSVCVKLSLKDHAGKPLKGVFSAAVVQDSRLSSMSPDIETAVYLSNELGNLPLDASAKGFRNKTYLEDVLLIRGWRRYTWQDLMAARPADSLERFVPAMEGRVTYQGKPLKSAVDVLAVSSEQIALIPTSAKGEFVLHWGQLITATNQPIKLTVNKSTRNYDLVLNDPYRLLTSRLAEQLLAPEVGALQNNSVENQETPSLQNTINLQTVEINGAKGNAEPRRPHGGPGANDCGDYVDEAGHLNYEKSSNRFKPLKDHWYMKVTDLEGSYFKVEPIFYTGCLTNDKQNGLQVAGIYSGKEYYNPGVNSDDIYGSTLYWRPGITTNAAGEAELRFQTNELTGNFRVVVQGVTADNLIYGVSNFEVK